MHQRQEWIGEEKEIHRPARSPFEGGQPEENHKEIHGEYLESAPEVEPAPYPQRQHSAEEKEEE
jgi:hypothetical protein